MDIPGQLIPWLVLGVSTLTAVTLVFAVRHLIRRAGHERVYEDGVVISDSGIEYFGLLFTGTRRVAYSEIASVDLIRKRVSPEY